MNEISKRLRALRESKEMSQKELAIEFGKAQTTIAKYENGRSQLDYEMIQKYSEYFGVTADYILGIKKVVVPGIPGATAEVTEDFKGFSKEDIAFLRKINR